MNTFTKMTLVAAAAALTFGFAAQKAEAHAHHTADICSATATDICAHMGYSNVPNTTDAWDFMLHFMTAVDPTLISNVQVKLWMDVGSHSHGSSPVTINKLDDVHFKVSEGYFPMAGPWQVKVAFDYNGAAHEIIIPIDVQ